MGGSSAQLTTNHGVTIGDNQNNSRAWTLGVDPDLLRHDFNEAIDAGEFH